MNRRSFLQYLGLGAATAAGVAAGVVDPERLLWVPGQKRIFDLGGIQQPLMFHPDAFRLVTKDLPLNPPTFLTPDIITQEALQVLENNLAFTRAVNRRYDEVVIAEQGMRIRMWRDYQFLVGDQWPRNRIDVLYGVGDAAAKCAVITGLGES